MEDKRIALLRDEPVNKAVNYMSIPAIVGLLVMAIYNLVDTMFVAWLGTEATGATQVVFPIMMLISAFGLAFGMGGGSYISRLLGRDRKIEANKVATVSFITSIFVGLFFMILSLIFMEPLLKFFGASDGIMEMAKSYGLYILLGSILIMGNMTMNSMLRAEGSAKLSMIGMAVGAVLNIILDPIFIFVLDLGISGAAIATSLSQLVTFIILISRYLNNRSIAKIAFQYFRPSKNIYYEILKVGIPTFFRQVLLSISLGILNQGAVIYGGEDLLAAVGLTFRVYMLPMYVLFGIGQGFQPVVGYNYGAKNKKRVTDSLKYSLMLSVMVAMVCSTLLIIFAENILGLFRATDAVVAYGVQGLRFYSIAMIFLAVTNTIGVFYQAIGKGKESLLLAIARQGLFFIPALFIMPQFLGATGILSAQLAADLATFVLSSIMFLRFIKKSRMENTILAAEA